MNKPNYKQEDELEELPETTDNDVQDELEKLPAWRDYINEGAESLTFGDY